MTLQEKLEKLRNHGCTEQEITEIADECLKLLCRYNIMCDGCNKAEENGYNKGFYSGISVAKEFAKIILREQTGK